MVLEKNLESPFESKKIQTVHPKVNQSWIFIGRTDAKAETPNTLTTWCEELTQWKRPWCWKRLKAGGERNDRGWDGWMASSTQWIWVWVNSGLWWWKGGLAFCSLWGRRVAYERLNCNSVSRKAFTTFLQYFKSLVEVTGCYKMLSPTLRMSLRLACCPKPSASAHLTIAGELWQSKLFHTQVAKT